VNALVVGEDRAFGGNCLYVDLIPKTAFYKNVRTALPRREWDVLSRFVRDREERCEACGAATPYERRQAHERWQYDNSRAIQRLVRLVSLCRRCHEATHFGLTVLFGNEGRAAAHLAAVNRWNDQQLTQHIDDAFSVWRERNRIAWQQDLSIVVALRERAAS